MLMTRREFGVLTASTTAVLLAGCKPKRLRLRKDVNSLSATELASYRAGVSAMGFGVDVTVLAVLSALFLVLGAWAFSKIQV